MGDPLDPNLMSPAERSRRCATFTVTVVPFIPAPCGVPLSVSCHTSLSRTPARSHSSMSDD